VVDFEICPWIASRMAGRAKWGTATCYRASRTRNSRPVNHINPGTQAISSKTSQTEVHVLQKEWNAGRGRGGARSSLSILIDIPHLEQLIHLLFLRLSPVVPKVVAGFGFQG